MSATAQASMAPVGLNPGLMVFLDDAATTIRPRIKFSGLGVQRAQMRLHNASQEASRSATVSEIRQSVATAHSSIDITVSPGIDIYCVAPGARPEPFEWFRGIVRDAKRAPDDITVRLHCFGTLSDEQTEIESWKDRFDAFRDLSGGAYLLSSWFRDVRMDRRRSYDVLARLAEVFALTGRSRYAPQSGFSVRRETTPFKVYVAGLESYAAPSHQAAAEWLFDASLWDEIERSLPIKEAAETNTDIESAEHWLLKAARTSSNLPEMATVLNSFGAAGGWIANLALEFQVAITNARKERPGTRSLHALERAIPPYEHPGVLSVARECARSMFRVFPFPIHSFFLSAPARATCIRAVVAERARQCGLLAAAVRESFYQGSQRLHRAWFPPNSSSTTDAANAAAALDVRVPGESVLVTCHLDPAVTYDEREELCLGPERIQFLHLIPVVTL